MDCIRSTAASLVLAALLVGCSDYLDRRDTLSLGSGEAVQTNINAHVIDPWPRVAQNRNLTFSGERMLRAARREACEDSPHSTTPQFQPEDVRKTVTARDAPAQGASTAGGASAGALPPPPPPPVPGGVIVNTGPGNVTVPGAPPAPPPPPPPPRPDPAPPRC